jgi:PAS domain S-box-containing protein
MHLERVIASVPRTAGTRRRPVVQDLTVWPEEDLPAALRQIREWTGRRRPAHLVIDLGERESVPEDVHRELVHLQAQMARDGHHCVIAVNDGAALQALLRNPGGLSWAATRDLALDVLQRQEPSASVRVIPGRGRVLVAVAGVLGPSTLRRVAAQLEDAIERARAAGAVHLDLHDLEAADVDGLQALVRVVVCCELAGARVTVEGTRPRVLALAYRLDWHTHLLATRADASGDPGAAWSVASHRLGGGPLPAPDTPTHAVAPSVMVTDSAGRIVVWNDAAETLYGWSADEAVGRGLRELLILPKNQPEGREIMAGVLRTGGWAGEFPVCHRDGPTVLATVRDSLVLDAAGNVAGVHGVSLPLTC